MTDLLPSLLFPHELKTNLLSDVKSVPLAVTPFGTANATVTGEPSLALQFPAPVPPSSFTASTQYLTVTLIPGVVVAVSLATSTTTLLVTTSA